ncbi:MAG: CBS domain-containing protein [Candidatus Pacearchaeota archaeon]
MQSRIRAGDIMTRRFIHAHPDTNVLDCAKIMIKNRVGSILLKDGEKIKGILTEKDIVWALTKNQGANFKGILAKDIATKKVITIKPEETLDSAITIMTKEKVRRLPVVSNKKVIGYLTLKDILKFRPSLYESMEEFQAIKEEQEKLEKSSSAMKGAFIESQCEECGNFDILQKIDGRMICESCKDEM